MSHKKNPVSKTDFTKLEINEFDDSMIPENLRTTVAKEAGDIYYTTKGSKKSLWNQWVSVSLKEIQDASTYQEACMAWENAPTMSFVKNIALEKMLSLTEDTKKILHIFRTAPHDSLVRYLAYGKMQKLKK